MSYKLLACDGNMRDGQMTILSVACLLPSLGTLPRVLR